MTLDQIELVNALCLKLREICSDIENIQEILDRIAGECFRHDENVRIQITSYLYGILNTTVTSGSCEESMLMTLMTIKVKERDILKKKLLDLGVTF